MLQKAEEEKEKMLMEKNKLARENEQLMKKNELLNVQVEQLQRSVLQKSCAIAQAAIDKQKEAEKVTANTLRKVFTPGQIKMLMSPNVTRIKWSSEDITSAIALRSLSPKAYRYLRNVKKMPLPCISTLNNWCGVFNIAPGILKDVFKIMVEKKDAIFPQPKNLPS